MLLDLNVLNGSISPSFNSSIFEYTVTVQDVTQLDLDLKVDKDLPVTIYGNDYLTDGENHVLIEIYDEKVNTYVLTVYKNSEEVVTNMINNAQKVEITTESLIQEDILTPGIISICFFIIVFLYVIIFHKK